MLLVINYDLKQPDKDYNVLYDTIKTLGDKWWHYLESTWLVHTNLSLQECSDRLKNAIDEDDFLFVVDITGNQAYQGWLPSKAWTWIRENNN